MFLKIYQYSQENTCVEVSLGFFDLGFENSQTLRFHCCTVTSIYYLLSEQLPPRKIAPRLGLGFGLGLVLRLGGQLSSGTIVLEPYYLSGFLKIIGYQKILFVLLIKVGL